MIPSKLTRRNQPTPEQLAEAAKPMTRLEERREELRARFTEMQWDLGGAAYEMAARDYFRLDVLAGMAARLQIVDAELAEIERMARLERAGAAGACAGCGSLHAQGAIYCWRCGRNLFETTARPALVAAPPPVSEPTPVTELVQPAEPAPAPTEEVAQAAEAPEPAESEPMPPVEPVPAFDSEPAPDAAPVMRPPFAGAVEIPTYERVPAQTPDDGPDPGAG